MDVCYESLSLRYNIRQTVSYLSTLEETILTYWSLLIQSNQTYYEDYTDLINIASQMDIMYYHIAFH
jgi:hypothetical protein